MNLTIVIPVKDEQGSIKLLYDEILSSMSRLENISYEIFFVDDGSKDESWNVIEQICKNDKKVKGFKFLKNYGKSVALNFCFRKSESDILITMDADLQDDPSEIPNLIEKTKLFDCVVGWKKTRNDPLIKTVPSKIFNFFNRKLFKINLHDINCGFKAYKKEVYKKLVIYEI